MLRLSLRVPSRAISSELIRQQLQRGSVIGRDSHLPEYPRTFEQKIALLNEPRSIQHLELVQFGVKYPPTRKYLSLCLLLAGLFLHYQEQFLPAKVVDSYFCISQESERSPTGYILAGARPQLPFYCYAPLLLAVQQLSRFISGRWIAGLLLANAVTCGWRGNTLVKEKLSHYQVWDQQRISYGEGTLLSLATMLWTAIGFKAGFTGLKARLLLKTVPGLGITRRGLPLAGLTLFYFLLEGYLALSDQKDNGQLVGITILNGVLFGLMIRRWAPLR